MCRKSIVVIGAIFLLSFSLVQGAFGQGNVMVEIEKSFTSITPVFMSGHEGNTEMIEGFTFEGDILIGGLNVGTFSGQLTLFNPPFFLSARYDQGFIKYVNTFPGIGSFEVTAQLAAFGSSTSESVGDGTMAWHGSISNGSGDMANIVGLTSGIGSYNLFTALGSAKEIIQVRFGY